MCPTGHRTQLVERRGMETNFYRVLMSLNRAIASPAFETVGASFPPGC